MNRNTRLTATSLAILPLEQGSWRPLLKTKQNQRMLLRFRFIYLSIYIFIPIWRRMSTSYFSCSFAVRERILVVVGLWLLASSFYIRKSMQSHSAKRKIAQKNICIRKSPEIFRILCTRNKQILVLMHYFLIILK